MSWRPAARLPAASVVGSKPGPVPEPAGLVAARHPAPAHASFGRAGALVDRRAVDRLDPSSVPRSSCPERPLADQTRASPQHPGWSDGEIAAGLLGHHHGLSDQHPGPEASDSHGANDSHPGPEANDSHPGPEATVQSAVLDGHRYAD